MKVVDRAVGPIRDRLAFFPDAEELRRLAEGTAPLGIVRVRQTTADPGGLPNLVSTGVFRTACVRLVADDDELLAGMRKDTRREIRIAQAMEDLELSCDRAPDHAAFLELYGRFARAKGHTKPMTERRLRAYERIADVWVARLGGEPVVVRMMMADPAADRVRFLYEGTARLDGTDHSRVTAPIGRWMHWRQMCAYAAKGIGSYDLGGIGDGSGPVAKFKLSLGGEPLQDRSCVFAGLPMRPFARRLP
ncbi:MAG: GNAT family N-acetyltransferase [Actinomycetota bacterium]